MRAAAGEVAAFIGMGSGISAIGDAVIVYILVTPKFLNFFKLFCIQHLAAVIVSVFVPSQRITDLLIHAKFEIAHYNHWRLQAVSQIKGIDCVFEALFRCRWKQQDVFSVSMGCIGAA